MLGIANALRKPLSVFEVTVDVQHNLRSELKHELLHIPTSTMASLRTECYSYESFFKWYRNRVGVRANTRPTGNEITFINQSD